MTAEPKKLHIKTYGCQMNVYDSDRMADLLAGEGYAPCAGPEDADMVILNTCHIREKAAEKVYSELGRLKRLKDRQAEAGNRMIIAVAGCVAQAEGEEMIRRAPAVDLVVGPQTYHRLPDMVRRIADGTGTARLVDTDFPVEEKFDYLPEETGAAGPSQFLTIQEGCDKFCSFCVVPYTRGAEVSRSVAAVETEARRLAAGGAREITLLGQNVNAYHGTGPDGRPWSLGMLLARLAEIEGIARLRYTTSHPRDVDDSLVAAHRDIPELVPFLHLPVQSGADNVLAAMNRRHTADDYRRIVESLMSVQPDLKLSSDFIVGHPGETDADFQATLDLVRDIGFIQAFSFKYSPRPGTPAADSAAPVPESVKKARLAELQALLEDQQQAFNRSCLGRDMTVLLDGTGRHAGQARGRTAYMQPVHVDLPDPAAFIGEMARVRITELHANSLHGELLEVGGDHPHHQGKVEALREPVEKVELRT